MGLPHSPTARVVELSLHQKKHRFIHLLRKLQFSYSKLEYLLIYFHILN
jgi:hypothetical protein